MITLQKLRWGKFFSYGDDNELDFTDNVVTQIIGINGNGKSSIPLILEEMIFNKNSKGIKKSDIPNRYLDDGYWGELTFLAGDDQYQIKLDRKASLKVKLFKNGSDISSHTATSTFKTIENLFGNDFKTTSQLVYQSPTSSLQFLTATDTARKKFLIDLLQLEEYVQLFELFKAAVKDHATEVAKIEAGIDTVERWLTQNRLEDLTKQPLLPISTFSIDADEREYAKLGLELREIDNKNKSISKNNEYKKLLQAIDIDSINAIEVDEYKSYDDEQSELGGLNSENRRLTTYIDKIEKLGDKCPTCEQEITSEFKESLIEGEKARRDEIKNSIKDIEDRIASIKENNKNHDYKKQRIKEWEELFRSVDKNLPSEHIDKDALKANLENLAIRISNSRAEIKKINEANQQAERINSRIDVYIEQADKFENELKELSRKLGDETKVLGNLEVLKKTFSTNGLIAYKIENRVKDLEDLTNEYLAELADGRFAIEFSVQSDKLNVSIIDDGQEVNIVALSSGELARVNTATLLAIRKLLSSISKSKINVLFLDEVINVLDELGREKLVEVLLQEDLNTYIVSHGWTHPLLSKLEVVKEDGVSRIEYV